MGKQYGSKNKGFVKANDNRRVERVRELLRKKGDHRKRGGQPLTEAEQKWLSENFSF